MRSTRSERLRACSFCLVLRLAVLPALLLALTAAGCGSKGTPSGAAPTGAQLDHDQYVAAVNAITTGEASRDATSLYFGLAAGVRPGYLSDGQCRVRARAFSDAIG